MSNFQQGPQDLFVFSTRLSFVQQFRSCKCLLCTLRTWDPIFPWWHVSLSSAPNRSSKASLPRLMVGVGSGNCSSLQGGGVPCQRRERPKFLLKSASWSPCFLGLNKTPRHRYVNIPFTVLFWTASLKWAWCEFVSSVWPFKPCNLTVCHMWKQPSMVEIWWNLVLGWAVFSDRHKRGTPFWWWAAAAAKTMRWSRAVLGCQHCWVLCRNTANHQTPKERRMLRRLRRRLRRQMLKFRAMPLQVRSGIWSCWLWAPNWNKSCKILSSWRPAATWMALVISMHTSWSRRLGSMASRRVAAHKPTTASILVSWLGNASAKKASLKWWPLSREAPSWSEPLIQTRSNFC